MQVAFVDIGLERHAFLHISDLKYNNPEDGNVDEGLPTIDLQAIPANKTRGGRGFPYLITDLISKNQELLVQVGKEPIGSKGARVTSNITLPGRYVVYLPNSSTIGVSRRIETESERERLAGLSTNL